MRSISICLSHWQTHSPTLSIGFRVIHSMLRIYMCVILVIYIALYNLFIQIQNSSFQALVYLGSYQYCEKKRRILGFRCRNSFEIIACKNILYILISDGDMARYRAITSSTSVLTLATVSSSCAGTTHWCIKIQKAIAVFRPPGPPV